MGNHFLVRLFSLFGACVSLPTVVRLRLFRRGLDTYTYLTYHTCNAPCEVTVYRFAPSNNPALFLARAEILLQAISEAAFPFALTKVDPFVFFLSFSTILHRANDLLTP